jgi:hypothetical protein
VLVAVSGGAKHLPLGRHIPGAGIPAVAQGEPPDTGLSGDDQSVGRVRVGVMHRTVAEFMATEHAATGNDHLELVGLVEVRPGDGARKFLDRKGHRVQRIVGRRLLGRRQGVAVGADIGGISTGRCLASAGAAGEDAVRDQDHGILPLLLSAAGTARARDKHLVPLYQISMRRTHFGDHYRALPFEPAGPCKGTDIYRFLLSGSGISRLEDTSPALERRRASSRMRPLLATPQGRQVSYTVFRARHTLH